jgi:hypothetical protein
MMKKLLLSLLVACFSASAFAIDFEEDVEYGADYLDQIPKAPLGAVDWKVLFSIGEEEVIDQGLSLFKPIFSPAVKKLSGKKVKIKGFMFPLDMAETQKHFLLSAFPPSCPFHAPGGPKHIIDINVEEGIEFTYDPLVIEGDMELIEFDEDDGLYYRLNNARQVEE